MIIGIIGLGIIGGSMAKCIQANTDYTVLGMDTDTETMALARLTGAIDGELTDRKLRECDLVMVALPPRAMIQVLDKKAPYMGGTLLVDMCGIKRDVYAPIKALSKKYGFDYVGGHPMAGKEVSGFTNASVSLFSGASMILTPDEDSNAQTLEMLKSFFLGIGFGVVTFSNIEEHDRIIAYTSQLAHITSNAYIKSPTAQMHMGFSAGSYKDLTRVARLDENMWTELFCGNNDYLVEELRVLTRNLNDFLTALEAKDEDRIRALLRRGRELKETAGGN
ncbi:MAG: prephenate dehydrogenase [Clostridia bacterium]|nr:prephenate dehydrogenase [Clostridia bacterium]